MDEATSAISSENWRATNYTSIDFIALTRPYETLRSLVRFTRSKASDLGSSLFVARRGLQPFLMSFIAQLPPVTIGLEAWGGVHYWARQLRHQGHQVNLMAPQFVKPYGAT